MLSLDGHGESDVVVVVDVVVVIMASQETDNVVVTKTTADKNDEVPVNVETLDGNDERADDTRTKTGWSQIGSKIFRRVFDDQEVEELYQSYCQRSRESDLDCFFLTGCLVAVHAAVSFSLQQHRLDRHQQLLLDASDSGGGGQQLEQQPDHDVAGNVVDQQQQQPAGPGLVEWPVLICAGVSSVVAVAQASLGFYIRGRKTMAGRAGTVDQGLDSGAGQHHAPTAVTSTIGRLTYAAWLLANVLILALMAVVPSSNQSTFTWLLLVNFLTFVTLPLQLRVCLLLTSAASFIFLVLSVFHWWGQTANLHQQVGFCFLYT